jgi:hypothetical protein
MSRLLLFLSTGRCGTQLLTSLLADCAGARADVSHEPIGPHYRPRQHLRMRAPEAALAQRPEVAAHFARWEELLASGVAVIETGWPLFAWLPYLHQRFAGAIEIVHLTRDPIRFAFSLSSHGFYSTRRDDNYTRHAALQPDDAGVCHRDYQSLWPALNTVERSLFQWLEVNSFAEELAQQGMIALRLRAEDLFADPGAVLSALRALHPHWAAVLADTAPTTGLVDRFQIPVSDQVHGVRYTRAVADLAARLGYAMDLEGQRAELLQRFFTPRSGAGA